MITYMKEHTFLRVKEIRHIYIYSLRFLHVPEYFGIHTSLKIENSRLTATATVFIISETSFQCFNDLPKESSHSMPSKQF